MIKWFCLNWRRFLRIVLPLLIFLVLLVLIVRFSTTFGDAMPLIIESLVLTVAIYAAWQYIDSVQYARAQKAIEMSNYYSNEIIGRHVLISSILSAKPKDGTSIWNKLSCIDSDKMRRFTWTELKNIYPGDHTEIHKLLNDYKFNHYYTLCVQFEAFHTLNPLYVAAFREYTAVQDNEQIPVEEKSQRLAAIEIDLRHMLVNDFDKLVTETLNMMEHFAMHFTCSIANDRKVYQSLHQTYISFIRQTYYFICDKNRDENERDRYYSNTLDLFFKWKAKDEKYQKRLDKSDSHPSRYNA